MPGHCVRLAERADTPELREKLLHLAREWMQAVMDDEDAERLARSSSGDGGRRQVSGTRGPGTELDSRTELERTRARFRSSHVTDNDHGNHSSRAAPGSSDLRHNPVVAPEAWTHPGGPRGFHTSALSGGAPRQKSGKPKWHQNFSYASMVGGRMESELSTEEAGAEGLKNECEARTGAVSFRASHCSGQGHHAGRTATLAPEPTRPLSHRGHLR